MTTLSGTFWGAEVYRTVVFPLNGDGTPKNNGLLPYSGLVFQSARSFTPNFGDAIRIPNVGDMRVRDTLILPTRDAATADLVVGYTVQDIDSQLTGVNKIRTVGESPMVHLGTDKQGSEPDIMLICMQLGHDDAKLVRWHYYLVPRARANPKIAPFNENAWEKVYPMVLSPSPRLFWGEMLTLENDGCTEVTASEGVSEGKINFTTWMADGIETEFPFDDDKPSISVDKVVVWDYNAGTEIDTGITVTTDKITFDDPPEDELLIMAKSEYD